METCVVFDKAFQVDRLLSREAGSCVIMENVTSAVVTTQTKASVQSAMWPTRSTTLLATLGKWLTLPMRSAPRRHTVSTALHAAC
jgi:hypothetical protein